jgi:PilZ domain
MWVAMITTQTKSTEQRKAERHARRLRISWRVLGNRDFHFGEAALKDIGATGLALQVDQCCPKGTLIIVQFEGAAERLAEPMLLQAAWSSELKPQKAGTPTYLVGCSFTSPLSEKDLNELLESAKNAATAPVPPKEAAAKTPAPVDPFLVGSAGEKRYVVRRGGLSVPVVLCRAGGGTPVEASVVDRSLKGLGILIHLPITRGTLLNVRPRDADEKMASVQVQVRNCRQKGKKWLVGCQFPHTPPANVLMLLG